MTIAKLFALHAYALKISYTVKLKITKYLKLQGYPGLKTNPRKIKLKKIKSTNNASNYM